MDVIFESINYLDAPNHESYIPDWGLVNDALNFSLGLVYTGENTDAQAILDEANTTVQGILDAYWAAH